MAASTASGSSSFRRHAPIIVAYLLLAVVFTWPLAIEGGSRLPRHNSDTYSSVWTHWWFRQALVEGQSLYSTPYLFYPRGLDLFTHAHSPLASALAALLVPFVGEIGAFNYSSWLVFVLGGWGMYLLCVDLTRRRSAAFVAGVVWAFYPYHLSQSLAVPNLASVQWLPFLALFLRRTVRGEGRWSSVAAGLFFALSVWSGLTLGVMAGLWSLVFVAAALVGDRNARSAPALKRLALALGVAVLLALPAVWPVLSGWSALDDPGSRILNERYNGQTDLAAWLTPPPYHPVWGQAVAPVYEKVFLKNRYWFAYLGLLPLALAMFAALRERTARFWWASGLLWMLMAAGACPRFAGQFYPDILLPYALVDGFLPFNALRSSDRFNLLVPLSLAVLVSLALARSRRSWPALVAGLLIGFEYLCVPLPMQPGYPQSAFLDRLAASNETSAVLDLPMGRVQSKIWMFLQTRHHQPIVEGMTARMPPDAHEFIESSELLAALRRADRPDPTDTESALARLHRDGVRFIVIHLEHARPEEIERWVRILDRQPDYSDEDFVVYATELAAGTAAGP